MHSIPLHVITEGAEMSDAEIVRSRAYQDQEVAEAADWYAESDPLSVVEFFDKLNDDDRGGSIREMNADEFVILRSLALIGLFEAVHANARKGGAS